ncbi:hypothetical protein GCM10017771_18770 [Streptomyces capitiformicae]|uniref:Uncharacterized protein n=1 Tax=Streptomyces capitiformicae TaxID=2014920 RepID=A0A919L6A1_9ACTN|nr:hypothetical protein GCM10017771_18770 [Streptomyces capitiformicae]
MISAQNATMPIDIPNQPHPLMSWACQNIIATHLLRLIDDRALDGLPGTSCPHVHRPPGW